MGIVRKTNLEFAIARIVILKAAVIADLRKSVDKDQLVHGLFRRVHAQCVDEHGILLRQDDIVR